MEAEVEVPDPPPPPTPPPPPPPPPPYQPLSLRCTLQDSGLCKAARLDWVGLRQLTF